MQAQATSNILMIRPVNFAFNLQTAESNAFQNEDSQTLESDITQENALQEFDTMVTNCVP